MNLGTIIGPMLMSLIEGVIENRFTRQNMKDKVDEIVHVANYNERVKDTEIQKKNEYIQTLEDKLKELETKLKSYADAGIESLEKTLEEKLPYVPHVIVDKVADVVKDAVHEVMDKGLEEVDQVIEKEAKDLGLVSDPVSVPNEVKSNVPDIVVSNPSPESPKSPQDFLSESAKDILSSLKKDLGD